MGFLTGINLVGAVLGFIAGVFGFIIVRYWIRPVSRYGRLKCQVADAVDRYIAIVEKGTADGQAKKGIKESQRQLRKLASELTDAFHHELPSWYRIRLRARAEDPPETAGLLMKLSGTRDAVLARKRQEEVRGRLHLQGGKK
jgi:hypothetical protein